MKSIIREVLQIALLALVVFFALHFMVQNFRIEGTSMEPNLHDRQYVIVNKTAYWFGRDPSRGDVVVFEAPDQPWNDRIKRVIGLPGETVTVKKNGDVYIDDGDGAEKLDEPYIASSYPNNTYGTWQVPEDYYFVMGDNRGVSYDSRRGGSVPIGNIIGKAWLVIWPPGDWGGAPNQSPELVPAS